MVDTGHALERMDPGHDGGGRPGGVEWEVVDDERNLERQEGEKEGESEGGEGDLRSEEGRYDMGQARDAE